MRAFLKKIFPGTVFTVVIFTSLYLLHNFLIIYAMEVWDLKIQGYTETVLTIISFVIVVLFFGNIIMLGGNSLAGEKRRLEKKILKERYEKMESDNEVDFLIK